MLGSISKCSSKVKMSLRDLSCLSSSELKSFLDSFDNVLCDCDGVICTAEVPIPGVKETISKLKECGKQIRFVSNNSGSGMAYLCKKLQKFGMDVTSNDIAYPNLAIISYLKKIQFNRDIFIMGSTIQKKEYKDAGFNVVESVPDKLEEGFQGIIDTLRDDKNVGVVVLDVDLNLTFGKLLKASTYLKRPDVLFITGATDKIIPLGANMVLIGPKGFIDILQDLSGRTPLEFGKPALNFNKYILERFNIEDASRTLFVGDSLEQDMIFASKSGYQKLLVLTGLTSIKQTEECANKDSSPDYYISSLGDLHGLIKNKLNI